MKRLLTTGFASTLILAAIAIPSAAASQSDHNPQNKSIEQIVTELDQQIKEEQKTDKTVTTKVVINDDGTQLLAGNTTIDYPREIVTLDELEELTEAQTQVLPTLTASNLLPLQITKPETTLVEESLQAFEEIVLTDTKTATIISTPIEETSIPDEYVIAATAEPPPEPEPESEPESVVETQTTTEQTTSAPANNNTEQQTQTPPAPANSIVETAMQYVGSRYVYGGSSPSGFDCSGFTSFVYRQHGITLPRTSYAQGNFATPISASEARPGDLVFSNGGGHVMIYLGNNQVVHASTPSTGVKVSNLWGSHWFGRVG